VTVRTFMAELKFGFHHGAISVPNMDETLEWYDRVLGFKLEKRFPIPAIPADVAIIKNGDLRMEVFEVAEAKTMTDNRRDPNLDNYTHGNKHVSFAIRHVESFGEELKRRGADIIWIKRMEHGANIFIRDNSGNIIEFVEQIDWKGSTGEL